MPDMPFIAPYRAAAEGAQSERNAAPTVYEQALAFTHRAEGGFTVDQGGRTDGGVSEKGHPDAWADGKVTAAEKKAIYEGYWKEIDGDSLPPKTARALFDYAVNSGSPQAITALQLTVNATADGRMGPQTRKAVLLAGTDEEVASALNSQRRGFMNRLALNNPRRHGGSLKGWMNRMDNLDADLSK